MTQLPEIGIRDLSDQQIRLLRDRRPIILVGSGISLFEPTSLPSGQALGKLLYELLFNNLDSEPEFHKFLEPDFSSTPFEGLMECYPEQASLPAIIKRLYQKKVPNSLHKSLAQSLINGAISSIITTNYDCAFESCPNINSQVAIIRTEAEYYSYVSSATRQGVYFKIHGSAEKGFENTLVFNLGHEGRLKSWKRELLGQLLEKRVLIVMCYSGRDFEVCPELANFKDLESVFWLEREEQNLTANAYRVLRKGNGTIVRGDINCFVQLVFNRSHPHCKVAPSALPDLKTVFNPNAFPEWRVRILDRLACPALGLCLLDELPTRSLPALRAVRSSLLAHAGKYYQAAESLEELANTQEVSPEEQVSFLADAAGRWLVYGSLLRYYKCLRQAEQRLDSLKITDRYLQVKILSTPLIGWMRVAQIARILHFDLLLRLIQRRTKVRYEEAIDYLGDEGKWDDLQIVQHNAERIGIADDEKLALSAKDGYGSLGLKQLEAILERDDIRYSGWTFSDGGINKLNSLIEKAEVYGWHPEAWKNIWLLYWRGSLAQNENALMRWAKHFKETEYPIVYRLGLLFYSLLPQKRPNKK